MQNRDVQKIFPTIPSGNTTVARKLSRHLCSRHLSPLPDGRTLDPQRSFATHNPKYTVWIIWEKIKTIFLIIIQFFKNTVFNRSLKNALKKITFLLMTLKHYLYISYQTCQRLCIDYRPQYQYCLYVHCDLPIKEIMIIWLNVYKD